MDDDVTRLTRSCPQCHKALGPDAPEGLCAACLLSCGIETLTTASVDEAVTMSSAGPAPLPPAGGGQLAGQAWGPYRVGRLLGRGGMGEVYEAEHVESGRRLALKVLRSRLQQADDRARFLREGQLAASVSHPHTVYIFGSEEIAGLPVITMELLPGGTLKDQVVARGPLPIAEAVSAVLDIIGGLDAAQAAGILHRDIKPSNCFVDSEGAVKVGDFGLSISTLARDVQQQLSTEGFQGTPQFAPPEQLRGEPLDIRADIYAVGATLYYLLTGRPPFDAPDLRTLFTRVTDEPATAPRRLRGEVPAGLSAVVMQCLAKSPSDRPRSYAGLADALRPFARADEIPAPRGVRFIACVVDVIVAGMPLTIWHAAMTDITVTEGADPRGRDPWAWLVSLAYFFCLEAWWGASLGKRMFGLRVSASGNRRVNAVALRTAIFHIPYLAYSLVTVFVGSLPALPNLQVTRNFLLNGEDFTGLLESGIVFAMVALLFATARQRNGWAGIHDLLSGTSVVSRRAARRLGDRSTSPSAAPLWDDVRAGARLGPFVVPGHVQHRVREATLAGIDPQLRREVWIHVVPPGTPPITAVRRDLSRVGRLHWLTGRRSPTENWDAYEAPDGEALIAREPAATEWPVLKSQLMDLAGELQASRSDGSMPPLQMERLWLRRDGRLVLLDLAPPPGAPRAASNVALEPTALLAALAARAVGRSTTLAPLAARTLLNSWATDPPPTLDEAHSALVRAASSADRVGRRKRALPIALASIPTIFPIVFTLAIALPTMNRFFGLETSEMLELLEGVYQNSARPDGPWGDPVLRDAAEIYLAGRHRDRLVDDRFWNSQMMRQLKDRLQPIGARIAAERVNVPEAEVTRASERLAPRLARFRSGRSGGWVQASATIVTTMAAFSLLFTALVGLVSSVVVPGGIATRLLGLAVVNAGGQEIGRGRSLLRAATAWSPTIVWLAYLAASPKIQGFVPAPPSPLVGTTLTLVLMAAGAAWAIARPNRGPHDRVAGTWVVPR